MATRIRLARAGAKKRPFYRIVVADQRSPRDGKFIEKLGTYNPQLPKDSDQRVVLDNDRAKHWLSQGAQPSERVARFLFAAGLIKEQPEFRAPQKGPKNVDKLRKHAALAAEARGEDATATAAPAEEGAAEAAPAEEAAAEAPAEEAPAEEAPAAEAEEEKPAE